MSAAAELLRDLVLSDQMTPQQIEIFLHENPVFARWCRLVAMKPARSSQPSKISVGR